MNCLKCVHKSVMELQHGSLCRSHFISYVEEKVFHTIKKYNLIAREDVLCVAASGGKDSLTVLYLTKKYLEKNKMDNPLSALAIDEGIHDYREKTLVDLDKFCAEHRIPLTIVKTTAEFSYTLDDAYPIVNKGTKKKPCNVCGVWRRYLLNKHARKLGATKVITGHNLDDEAQAVIMNIFKANTGLAAHLGPISGVEEQELFVQRVKPLYFCTEKETRLYALLQKFQVEFAECPYANEGFRAQIRDMLNDFEAKYKGTKQGIINSFLAMLPLLKEQARKQDTQVNICAECGEPAQGRICHACQIRKVLP
ncbi:TIGR00269 family protein [Candidatus Woesearchaeota archaeon]|nr:TIGR00269 family protein [Candidatus Woesearchaeota archaeon]